LPQQGKEPVLTQQRRPPTTETAGTSLLRSRSAGLVLAMFVSSLATGVLQIAIPLELADLRASPNQIGFTLAMFGLGMFVFEWLWGAIADRFGYRTPLLAAQVLYGASIVVLAGVHSVGLIAAGYLIAAGMMVAAGPIGRSYVSTSLPDQSRATGLAYISAAWVIGAAIGSGAGGVLIEWLPIRSVVYGSAILPVVSAVMVMLVLRGDPESHRRRSSTHDETLAGAAPSRGSVTRVLVVAATMILLIDVGVGGETALLPLLVTAHLHLSAANAGTALFAVGLLGGLLLVPGGAASDRWGRRPTMIVGGLVSAAGFVAYSIAGNFWQVIAGAVLRAVGESLIWPAATAWIAESMPRRRHALMLGVFGEFENAGVTAGPLLGGFTWSVAGLPAAFLTYAGASLLAAGVAAIAAKARKAP
jgi:MFS family permease